MYSQSLESTSNHEGGKGLSPYTMDQTTTYYTLGIDIGSTTVKVALLDQDLHIIFSDYERHYANIQETLAGLLKKALNQTGPIDIIPVITGSGGLTLSSHLHVPFVQEVVAVASALQDYAPQTDVAIELGGEDAKIIYFTGGIDQRMNGICAGGTGSFIDQMASLLQTDATGLNEYAKHYQAIYPIAARCGVFAKTDIQPLINDGATKEDLSASIFQAVVNQTISGHTADFLLFRRIFLFSQCTSPLLFCPLSLNLIRFSTHQSIGSGILRISVCKRYDYISVKKQPFSCITVIYKRNLMLGNIQFLRKDLLIPAVLI